ncbi:MULTISPECIES: hypothetical protein [Rhodococcus erythropolis group]|uniref:HEPN domain-containing protein n=2 Tax=Rhodococcus erythropolis TaxID=1833 RepID=A0A8I0ZQB1_RHOER|nr:MULTISPECIES: hypothetical protein [Rhodococcus erythropolis group]MBH5143676.1 hypothetical protein [Rhodococcus erythropolis]
MLLDNTAELLLKRECDSKLSLNHLGQGYYEAVCAALERGETEEQPTPFDDDDAPPRKLVDVKAELERKLVSDGDLKKIESEFAPKVAYLQLNDVFSPSHAAVLRRMHLYRNEIYHDDKVRPATVEAAAKIYTYVVCDLMQRSSSSGVPIAMSAPTPELDALFPEQKHHPSELGRYADRLLALSPIDTAEKLAKTLSEHLIDRLEELDLDLSYVQTRGSNCGVVIDEELRARALDEILAGQTLAKKISYRTVRQWKGSARKLGHSADYVKAFEKFATTETALEDVEDQVHHVVRAIDAHINEMIDWRRGK